MASRGCAAIEMDLLQVFLDLLAEHGGSIVSTASLKPIEITMAKAAGRLLVLPNGLGYVYLPPKENPR